jgi:hypothetical protein
MLISQYAINVVRERATDVMRYECRIERVKKPSFNQATGTAIPGSKTVIYEGKCRLWEVSGGGPIMIGEDDVVMQNTQLSIPWDTSPVPERDDEVEITAAPTDGYAVGKRYVIDSSAKAGELRATRRFTVRGYQKS